MKDYLAGRGLLTVIVVILIGLSFVSELLALVGGTVGVLALLVWLAMVNRGPLERRERTMLLLLNAGVCNWRFLEQPPRLRLAEMRDPERLRYLRKRVAAMTAIFLLVAPGWTAFIAYESWSEGMTLPFAGFLPYFAALALTGVFLLLWLSQALARWERSRLLGYDVGTGEILAEETWPDEPGS